MTESFQQTGVVGGTRDLVFSQILKSKSSVLISMLWHRVDHTETCVHAK